MNAPEYRVKPRHEARIIAEAIGRDSTVSLEASISVFPRRARERVYPVIAEINERARLAARDYMRGYDRRREIECRVAGIPPWPPSKVERKDIDMKSKMPPRVRKKENAKRKKAQWMANHVRRAAMNNGSMR